MGDDDEALLSDSRRRIGGVELCESLDIFQSLVVYPEGEEREKKNGGGGGEGRG
jgi:hypothetical protein